jgi:magnesium-transporting ATPase (P-type)
MLEKTKGKTDSLNIKINKASIKDMKEQSYIPAAFFEQFKNIYLHPEDAAKIYDVPISDQINNKEVAYYKIYTYNSKQLKEASQRAKNDLKKYGDILTERYLEQGLTEKEVLARRDRDGLNKLPEKKSTPEIVKFFHEIFSVFANLLWIAAVLAFIGYALTPWDLSNVSLYLKLAFSSHIYRYHYSHIRFLQLYDNEK